MTHEESQPALAASVSLWAGDRDAIQILRRLNETRETDTASNTSTVERAAW
jgi:hypothetical protein